MKIELKRKRDERSEERRRRACAVKAGRELRQRARDDAGRLTSRQRKLSVLRHTSVNTTAKASPPFLVAHSGESEPGFDFFFFFSRFPFVVVVVV